MEIIGDGYKVFCILEEHTVKMEGSIRLRDAQAYQEISDVLKKSFDESDQGIILDVRGLEFLNSSGINTISKFVLYARKIDDPIRKIKCIGSENIYWQKKSLQNLQKLWREVDLSFF